MAGDDVEHLQRLLREVYSELGPMQPALVGYDGIPALVRRSRVERDNAGEQAKENGKLAYAAQQEVARLQAVADYWRNMVAWDLAGDLEHYLRAEVERLQAEVEALRAEVAERVPRADWQEEVDANGELLDLVHARDAEIRRLQAVADAAREVERIRREPAQEDDDVFVLAVRWQDALDALADALAALDGGPEATNGE